MDMSDKISIPDQHRRLLLDIAAAIGATSDELTAGKFEAGSPEHARGYLEGFLENASDEKILLAYSVVLLVLCKTR